MDDTNSRVRLDSAPVIALIVVCSFIGLVALWMLHPPAGDETTRSFLNGLIMVVGTAFLTIVNNYFSSTRSSQTKDDTIRALSATPSTGNGSAPAAAVSAENPYTVKP